MQKKKEIFFGYIEGKAPFMHSTPSLSNEKQAGDSMELFNGCHEHWKSGFSIPCFHNLFVLAMDYVLFWHARLLLLVIWPFLFTMGNIANSIDYLPVPHIKLPLSLNFRPQYSFSVN